MSSQLLGDFFKLRREGFLLRKIRLATKSQRHKEKSFAFIASQCLALKLEE
jgi:hypothetical protein